VKRLNILFVHQNFPGQFKHLAPALAQRNHSVKALRQAQKGLPYATQGVVLEKWQAQRGTCLDAHPWAHDTETKLIRGEAAAAAAFKLKGDGWCPDLIVGHPGWGEMLFLHHIWPQVPQLHFLEFFYRSAGLDVGFDPEFPLADWQSAARVTAKSGPSMMGLENMTAALSPTHFQASTYPAWARDRIEVIHDGINTSQVVPNPGAHLRLGRQGPDIRNGDPVLTFVNRNLEPYRGYHRFMRALPSIQQRCPNAITVIVGGHGVSYGAAAPEGKSWKDLILQEVNDELDLSRVFFTGKIAYRDYLTLLQVSACHVYFTYPFVLGWSCLEAMAAGALVVGSATPPVQEVICNGENGLLVDFFDQQALVETVSQVLNNPEHFTQIRQAARISVVKRFDLETVCLPKQLQLIDRLLSHAPIIA
jgi:glycosyltransferase involved in cell wall biosynthesis